MKTSFSKLLFLIFMFSLSASMIYGQEPIDSEDPDPGATITPDISLFSNFVQTAEIPKVKSSSVIFYSDAISVSVAFETAGTVPQNFIFVDKNNASDTRTIAVAAGASTEFAGVTPGKTYEIKALASSGIQYIVGTVNTSPFVAGEPVVVSENLYRALSQYVTVENQGVTLSNYLKQLPNVPLHEKISFAQRYIMNGATIPGNIKGVYPDVLVKDALDTRKTEGDCLCNFVMNQVTVVIPDETGSSDFSIGEKVTVSGPRFYNNASYWFRGLTAEGPAKHLLLLSEGKRAGNKKRTETWESGGNNISDNLVRIGYHLMCVGQTELPRECDCEKTVKYDFGYSTRVEARSNTGGFGCVLNQDAASRAQDWAVALVTREKVNSVNDVQVLQSGACIATSKCSGGVPVSVIVDAAKIGVSVFQLVKSVKTAQLNDIVNQTNQIIDKVGAVLEKVTETKECDNALIEKPILQGTANLVFKPNDPLSFLIMSGSNLETMGLRCWVSEARIKSSFHLAGVVQGGAPTPSTPYCCTNYFANWAYASQNNDHSNRRNYINGHLALNSPGGWQKVNGISNPSGIINANTEIGYAIGVNLPHSQNCKKEIPIFNNPR